MSTKKNLIFMVLCFALGFYAHKYFFHVANLPKNLSQDNFDLFTEVWNSLEEKYSFDKPATDQKIYGAINGLVDSYQDDYSHFYTPEEAQFLEESIEGHFAGIGVEVSEEYGHLVVVSPLKDSAADKAGIKSGDLIIKVDGENIQDKAIDISLAKIRGEIGTKVTITVLRLDNEEELDFEIIRERIEIPILDQEIIDDVYVISLYNFNEGSEETFTEALENFKESKTDKLLVDLRNNPGGYLVSSIDTLSHFVGQGEVLLKESFGDKKDSRIHRSKGFDTLDNKEYSLAVLINKGSASASEIFAGAIQDHEKGLVIGENSFGKGSVQELLEFSSEPKTLLKVTIAKWLTPNGTSLDKVGITPDHLLNSELDFEEQINEAIKILKNS